MMAEHSWNVVYNTWLEQLLVLIILSMVYYLRYKHLDENSHKEYNSLYILTSLVVIIDIFLWTYNIDLKYLSYQVYNNSNPNGELVTVFHFISIIGMLRILFYKDKYAKKI